MEAGKNQNGEDEAREPWTKAAAVAFMGLDFTKPGVFGTYSLEGSWDHWLRHSWPNVQQALQKAYHASVERNLGDLWLADAAVGHGLPQPTSGQASNLRRLTQSILASTEGAKRDRFLCLFERSLLADHGFGYPCTAHAVKAASFHLGPLPTCVAWLYYEWRSASRQAQPFDVFLEQTNLDEHIHLAHVPSCFASSPIPQKQRSHA